MRQIILNFHGIGAPKRTLEPGEAPYWVSEDFFAQTLALADRYKDRVRTDITFDDGNMSDAEIALPLLGKHNRHAIFFMLADRIDTSGSLDKDAMRALIKEGHRIGSHGAAHMDWSGASAAQLEHELGAATRDAIATAAGQPVMAAAIPFGRYNAKVLRALSRHGYEQVYSSDGGAWRSGQWPIPRTSPRQDMTLADIENIMLGREPAKARLRRKVARAVKRIL